MQEPVFLPFLYDHSLARSVKHPPLCMIIRFSYLIIKNISSYYFSTSFCQIMAAFNKMIELQRHVRKCSSIKTSCIFMRRYDHVCYVLNPLPDFIQLNQLLPIGSCVYGDSHSRFSSTHTSLQVLQRKYCAHISQGRSWLDEHAGLEF